VRRAKGGQEATHPLLGHRALRRASPRPIQKHLG
jgi:hypothetical protein